MPQPPDSIGELLERTRVFVKDALPEADGFAQESVARDITKAVWLTIEAWRSVKKKARR